jgi:tryptophan-rich sensory protein
MYHWILILFLVAGVVLVIHPSHADYLWYQSLRRPSWLPFHVWSPVFQLLSYAGVVVSLALVWTAPGARPWSMAAAHLLLIALNQATLCFTCQTRRLKGGSLVGAAVTSTALALALAIFRFSPVAALALAPFVLWSIVENLAQWQMTPINSGLPANRGSMVIRPQLSSFQSVATSRRRGR